MTSEDTLTVYTPVEGTPFNIILEEDIADMVEAIRQSRGADPIALVLQGVEIFLQLSHKYYLLRPLEVDAEFKGLCRALVWAQPDCAPLVNFANDMIVLEGEYGEGEGELMRTAWRARAEQWRGEMLWREGQRIMRTARLVEEGSRLLCHGYSTDIVGALREAKVAGLGFSVNCVEGLPRQEGHALAEELGRYDIAAQVVSDDAASSAVGEATLVLGGAYSFTEQGLVHRAGTYVLARTAKERQVPFYALGDSEKFFPAGYRTLLQEARALLQEASGAPEQALAKETFGPEWDVIPWEYLTGVVTSNEILAADALPEFLAKRKKIVSILVG